MRKEVMKRVGLAVALTVAFGVSGARAAALKTYTSGLPMPPQVNMTSNVAENAWLVTNNFVHGTGGYAFKSDAASGYSLPFANVGPAYSFSPYGYTLGDRLQPPAPADQINWAATYEAYLQMLAREKRTELTGGFVFSIDGANSYVVAARGIVTTLDWILKDGTVITIPYNVAPYGSGRPKRIYWTDYPYNNQKVDLSGKFFKFFGKPELVEPEKQTVTNDIGGVFVEEKNKIVSGLYLNKDSMALEARGEEEGQVLMVYYKDGNYDAIQHMQVIEVVRPDTLVLSCEIGQPVKANGRGYRVEGLRPVVQAGIGDVKDGYGDYLYRHEGQHSYSAHNGDVYPLRPTYGEPWKAEVCWMEEDAMKVYWPFEIDQYETYWSPSATSYVRGDLTDEGQAITFPDAYTPTLMTYQEPFGHAKDISADNVFTTDLRNTGTNVGYALVKLAGSDDSLNFLTIKSILRSNTNYYTLAKQESVIGQPLALDGVSRTALAREASFWATPDAAPYVYLPNTPAQNYDINLYSETNIASVVYPVSTAGDIEVWWKTRVQTDTMPEPVDIPTLPTVFRPRWPETAEAPQIVLASQQGSAAESLWGHYGAATFDTANGYLAMPSRAYFPQGAGTLAFWSRLRDITDPSVTNGTASVLKLFGERDRSLELRFNMAKKQIELLNGSSVVARAVVAETVSADWKHFALVIANGTAAVYIDERQVLPATKLSDSAFLAGALTPVLGYSASGTGGQTVVPEPFVPSEEAVDCGTWADVRANLQAGNSVRLTANVEAVGETVEEQMIVLPGKETAYTNTLDLNSYDITGTAGICLITITNKVRLVVGDSSAKAIGCLRLNGGPCGYLANGGAFDLRGGAISGGLAVDGGAFEVAAGGKLILNGGTISDCAAVGAGGAVHLADKAEFTMNGGTIENCSAGYGGAVNLVGGLFALNAGTIRGCTADWGGGVQVSAGQMIQSGGTISTCRATNDGGGVFSAGTYQLVGGQIVGNTAGGRGAGADIVGGTFAMNGGEITGNTSPQYPCLAIAGKGTLVGGTLDAKPTQANLAYAKGRVTVSAYAYNARQGFYYIGIGTTVGRQVAEVLAFSRALTTDELAAEKFKVHTGDELGLTGYWSFRPDEDLITSGQTQGDDFRAFHDRTADEKPLVANAAHNAILSLPGVPLRSPCVLMPDDGTEPAVYRQSDSALPGYNPNEEHAFAKLGSDGYVVWALRCDLGLNGAKQGVFTEYVKDGIGRLQFCHVLATNDEYPTFGAACLAGYQLPGPQPLTLMSDPWLAEDYWKDLGEGEGVYRDRKGQLWCRRGNAAFDIYLYYRNQDGFDWPTLGSNAPAAGTAVPWLSVLAGNDALKGAPNPWRWTALWDENVPEMKVGQTVTVASDGLAEVWNAHSIAVVYPAAGEGTDVVMLSDPTVMQSVELSKEVFPGKLKLAAEPNGGLTLRQGKYRFTEASPYLSERLYWDATTERLCLTGERDEKKAGATILYPNVLGADERTQIKALVKDDAEGKATWDAAVDALATAPVLPNDTRFEVAASGKVELMTTYGAVDHYALTALGGYNKENAGQPLGSTNYVVLIENDATDETMAFKKGSVTEREACVVGEGDSVNMHVYKIVPKLYLARAVTREDANNLLSQQLSVLYSDPLCGKADDYVFEWASHETTTDGHVPTPPGGYTPSTDPDKSGPGCTRFVIGKQGDTLANMVDRYWSCHYRAKEDTTAARVVSTNWSEWVETPALAEGWVKRCLNNVTPFTQRMTDLYNNKAETPVTMLQEAGGPYKGDVALNQDNLTSVGLIELYETILNKAESMSLAITTGECGNDVSEQLLLAAERLGDLYKVLGDEAYSDAKNPTIGFGQSVDGWTKVDFGSEASSLFCFDNQVKTLLDEELALLRGRSGAYGTTTTRIAPYYNRLVWNFTRGITAGEVAYAVNYAVDGVDNDKARLSEEEAAALYPQGHGDAYGHYLSALKGWYRLLRNPNFSWARAQGAMNVADTPVNVDYYEEAKFATAAADVAKTAADVVDLTARAAWRDNGDGVTSPGYLDSNPTNAFGYGEWASRGGYGALCNWVVANSLLPEDQTLSGGSGGSGSSSETSKYTDQGLMRIDRGNTDELAEICDAATKIVRAVDRIDCGLNPLGLSDNAIPFDIAPTGVADGSNTHFEQVRDRATTALGNARKVLERAQTQSSRMRMIQTTGENLAESYAQQEEAFDEELLTYFGSPYSDDIGPGKTYSQGYEGADLYHYLWLDFESIGLSKKALSDYEWEALSVTAGKIAAQGDFAAVIRYMNSKDPSYYTSEFYIGEVEYDVHRSSAASSLGVVCKPDSITGYRNRPGKIQEKLMEFLRQYQTTSFSKGALDKAWNEWHEKKAHLQAQVALDSIFFAAKEAKLVADGITSAQIAALEMVSADKQLANNLAGMISAAIVDSTPSVIGAGMTVVTSPRSVAQAVQAGRSMSAISTEVAQSVIGNTISCIKLAMKESQIVIDGLKNAYDVEETLWGRYEAVMTAAKGVSSAYSTYHSDLTKLNVLIDECRTVIAEGQAILDRREAARKRQVNALSKLRYNEMLFRQMRDKTLSQYSAAFDLAQKYVFMAAQVYDYETGLKREEDGSHDDFKAKIVATRSLGAFDSEMQPMVADDGDLGLAGYLAQMNANWLVLKPRLGINNPQPYTTWFSLRKELFRIYGTEAGDANWKTELKKYWTDDIRQHPVYRQHCQKFQSQFGLKDKEPGFVIPFSTTIDFAKNLFGNDLAGCDHAYDSSWYSTRIASAGVWFDGYNELTEDAAQSAQGQLAANPTVYLVPTGHDCLRAPGQEDGWFWQFSVVDQVIAAPYAIGSYELDSETWYPSMKDADWEGTDPTVKIRRHPMFRAYYGAEGAQPGDERLDATRLIGRSVWNDQWYLIIPAGSMNADRDKAMDAFLNGYDTNRDGKIDVKPVTDIKIGFRTYSQSGN